MTESTNARLARLSPDARLVWNSGTALMNPEHHDARFCAGLRELLEAGFGKERPDGLVEMHLNEWKSDGHGAFYKHYR